MAEKGRMTAVELVDKLMGSEHADVVRESVAWLVAEVDGGRGRRRRSAPSWARSAASASTQRNGYRERGRGTRARASWSCGSRSCARARTSRAFWSRAGAPSRRWSRSSRRPTSTASPRARSTGWSSRWACTMSKDQVSRLCRGLDEQVQAFRERPLEGRYPYLWLDGKIEKVRERGGVRQKCLVIAYAVHETGRREVIGLDVGEAETEAFWREFLRSLRRPRPDRRAAVRLRLPRRAASTRSARCSAARGSAAPCTSCATCSATAPRASSR